jgi:hypothetical protein
VIFLFNRARFLIFLLPFCLGTSARADLSSHLDLYSEHTFDGREEMAASSLRLRNEFQVPSPVLPYLAGGEEIQTPGFGAYYLDPGSSYVYGAPGLYVPIVGALSFRSELRVRKYLSDVDQGQLPYNVLDFRSMLVWGALFEQPTQLPLGPRLFEEMYSEAVFSSTDYNNLISASYFRTGLRFSVTKSTLLDVLVEPFLTLDRIGHYYNNRAELRGGFRVVQSLGPVALSLTGYYAGNQYFSYAKFDNNPYQGHDSGFRALLVVGGYW